MHSWSYATVLSIGLFLSAQADAPYVYENKELGVKLRRQSLHFIYQPQNVLLDDVVIFPNHITF